MTKIDRVSRSCLVMWASKAFSIFFCSILFQAVSVVHSAERQLLLLTDPDVLDDDHYLVSEDAGLVFLSVVTPSENMAVSRRFSLKPIVSNQSDHLTFTSDQNIQLTIKPKLFELTIDGRVKNLSVVDLTVIEATPFNTMPITEALRYLRQIKDCQDLLFSAGAS